MFPILQITALALEISLAMVHSARLASVVPIFHGEFHYMQYMAYYGSLCVGLGAIRFRDASWIDGTGWVAQRVAQSLNALRHHAHCRLSPLEQRVEMLNVNRKKLFNTLMC